MVKFIYKNYKSSIFIKIPKNYANLYSLTTVQLKKLIILLLKCSHTIRWVSTKAQSKLKGTTIEIIYWYRWPLVRASMTPQTLKPHWKWPESVFHLKRVYYNERVQARFQPLHSDFSTIISRMTSLLDWRPTIIYRPSVGINNNAK